MENSVKWINNRLIAVSGLPGVGKTSSLEKISGLFNIPFIKEPLDDSFSFSEIRKDPSLYLKTNYEVVRIIRFKLLPEILKSSMVILDRYPLDVLVWLEFNKVIDKDLQKILFSIDDILRKLYFVKILLILERPKEIKVENLLNNKRYQDLFDREEELKKMFISVYKNHCCEIIRIEELEKKLKEFLCLD